MDTFFEQIISIKKTGGKILGIFGLWFLAFIICAGLFLFGGGFLGSLVPIIIFGVLFELIYISVQCLVRDIHYYIHMIIYT